MDSRLIIHSRTGAASRFALRRSNLRATGRLQDESGVMPILLGKR